MPARTRARKRALDILYESELRGVALSSTLSQRLAAADPPLNDYTIELVEGVMAHAENIDNLLTEYAVGWTLDRMPAVDRNVLRMATFEILYRDDVPDPVVINEAVELARDLSTDDSPKFVNGLLAKIVSVTK